MREPSLRSSRLAIAGGLLTAIVLTGAGFMLGRTTSSRPEPAPPVVRTTLPVAPPPPKADAPRTLGRADIIALGERAADALTSGTPLPAELAIIAGRRLELVLPFGCDGPAPETSTAPLRWRYDADEQALRIHVAPNRWRMGDWGLAQPAGAEQGLEGFWVSRPWSSAERCPKPRGQAAATDDQPVTLPGQTLAVAEIVSDGQATEAQRDDRTYEIVKRVSPGDLALAQGLRLRLIGRIDRLPGGRSVTCIQPAGIEQRPLCLVAVSLEELRIENPEDDGTLATWSMHPAQRSAP